jgi:hypothetical protein
MDKFYEIGKQYRHMSYAAILTCIGETDTHVVMQGDIEYHFPKTKRHKWMYKHVPKDSNIK